MNGPSRHLTWKELQCNDGTPYPQKFIHDGRVFQLATAFEDIRHLCGDKPIAILSAYRTKEHNRKVGGAPNSQHMQGRALDLRPPKGMTVMEFYRLIHANTKEFGINGIGLYKTFVHIDIRPSDRLVAWSSTMSKESKA
jgi:uncharacterized protein YcbK (DUF882 family)